MRIFIAEHVLDEATCRRVQAAMDASVPEPAEVLQGEMELVEDVRRASHIEVPEPILRLVETCLDGQRDAIGACFGRPLSSREGASLLRYEVGDFYGPHVDQANVPSWPEAAEREVTVVLFLDSSRDRDPAGAFSGGLLRLLPDSPGARPLEIVARRGTLIAFPSDTGHEVTPVTEGRRDVVVDWFRSGSHRGADASRDLRERAEGPSPSSPPRRPAWTKPRSQG